MSCSTNKLKPHILSTCKNFMFSEFAWKNLQKMVPPLVYYFIYSSARKVFRKIATRKNFVKMQHMFRKAWKAGFPLANFLVQSDFFHSKTIKSRIGSYFFYFEKSG